MRQNREDRRGDFHRMDSSPGQLGTPGSRTSSVLPDLLTQVSYIICKFQILYMINFDSIFVQLMAQKIWSFHAEHTAHTSVNFGEQVVTTQFKSM